jgi:hypothetical protein
VTVGAAAEDAAALERLIASLDPDAIDSPVRREAQDLALRLALVAPVGGLAAVMARTLAACKTGEVEPHHAVWRLASAAQTLRQEHERIAAGGAASEVAVHGACYDLAILFPRAAGAPQPPTADDLELVPSTDLVRRR